MQYLLILSLVFFSSTAFSAPESGLSDSELLSYNLVISKSPSSRPSLDSGVELCVFASPKPIGISNVEKIGTGAFRQKANSSRAAADASSPCANFQRDGELFVSAKLFPVESFHAAMWNSIAEKYGTPLQWTLLQFVKGKAINDAYVKLRELCHDRSCFSYRATLAGEFFAVGILFPITDTVKKLDLHIDAMSAGSNSFSTISESLEFLGESTK